MKHRTLLAPALVLGLLAPLLAAPAVASAASAAVPGAPTAASAPAVASAPATSWPAGAAPIAPAVPLQLRSALLPSAAKVTQKAASAVLVATSNVNLRKSWSASSARLTTVPRGAKVDAMMRVSNGWWKVLHQGRVGYVSGSYLKKASPQPTGRYVHIPGKYTSNRAGLSDRYYTKANGSDLFRNVGGKRVIGDIPKNSVVYRDLANERLGGQRAGWFFVRTQGTSGWMRSADLQRGSTAGTSNSRGYTRAQVRSNPNGKVPSAQLVAIPWDAEKTLIAAPALKDLTRMNDAFKKAFGKNIDVDLAYRTRETQDFYWRDLGPFIAAKPGTSNHGFGDAIDVPETYDYSFRGKYYRWLKANGAKYNWVHRGYLEEFRANGTRNPYAEAWHFEYVGK